MPLTVSFPRQLWAHTPHRRRRSGCAENSFACFFLFFFFALGPVHSRASSASLLRTVRSERISVKRNCRLLCTHCTESRSNAHNNGQWRTRPLLRVVGTQVPHEAELLLCQLLRGLSQRLLISMGKTSIVPYRGSRIAVPRQSVAVITTNGIAA